MLWERCPVRECWVRRHDTGFKFMYMCDDLCRVHQESARGAVSEDIEVRREGLGVFLLRSGAENGLYGYFWLFGEHTKEGISILKPALAAGVFE